MTWGNPISTAEAEALLDAHGRLDERGRLHVQLPDKDRAAEVHNRFKFSRICATPRLDGRHLHFTYPATVSLLDTLDDPRVSLGRGRSGYDRDAILDRDDHRCQRCGRNPKDDRPLEVAHHIDHGKGGSDHPENLRTLCIACHSEVDDWETGQWRNGRVGRAASYVRDYVPCGDNAEFIRAFMKLVGIDDAYTARELLKDRGFL